MSLKRCLTQWENEKRGRVVYTQPKRNELREADGKVRVFFFLDDDKSRYMPQCARRPRLSRGAVLVVAVSARSLTHSRGFFLSIGVFILRSLTNERMNERTNSSEIKERKREKTTTTVRQTEREIRNDLEVWSFPRSYKRVMNAIHTTLSCCCSSSSSWEEKIRVWRGECTIVIACSSFRWKNNENFPVLLILSLLSTGAFIL